MYANIRLRRSFNIFPNIILGNEIIGNAYGFHEFILLVGALI